MSESENDGRQEQPASLTNILEALLFATSEPLSVPRLSAILKEHDSAEIRNALAALREAYDVENRAFSLDEIGGGFRLLTRPEFAEYVRRLQKVSNADRLSPAALETLAIVAYKQPVIKAEIDAIRGVKSEGTIQSLLRRHLVRVVGRADVLGRPLLYGTTRLFLDQFGLKSLDELPSLEEAIQKMEAAEMQPLEEAQVTQVDLETEDVGRDDGLLVDALPDVPAFKKDAVLEAMERAAAEEREREAMAAASLQGEAAGDGDGGGDVEGGSSGSAGAREAEVTASAPSNPSDPSDSPGSSRSGGQDDDPTGDSRGAIPTLRDGETPPPEDPAGGPVRPPGPAAQESPGG